MPLHNRYQFEFNNETSVEHGVYIEHRPDIPIAEEDVEFVEIAGRESPIMIRSGRYDNIKITIECGFKVDDANEWSLRIRNIGRWLAGSGKLILSDGNDTFYRVHRVIVGDIERVARKYGKFEVEFTCEPFEYLLEGTTKKTVSEAKYNPYSECKPQYIITGSGSCTLRVNGNAMTASVTDNITIDTERMLSYREDDESVKELLNTKVSGEYDELHLMPGENTISITSGFTLSIVPNWRYT